MPLFSKSRRLLLACVALAALTLAHARADDAPVVAAASDLKFALDEIAARFRETSKQDVKIVYGSSGNFFRQIAQGAPFQLFLSADEDFVLQLADKGLTLDRGEPYAIGRIALLLPASGALKADATLADLAAALDDGRLKKFAIANPEHAPYGRAAREALQRAGVWDKIQPRLVLGENVAQAAQFALSGSTQGGIVAYSLVLAPEVAKTSTYALLPAQSHAPLRQRMVLMRGAGETARSFFDFLQRPLARATLGRYGFTLPDRR